MPTVFELWHHRNWPDWTADKARHPDYLDDPDAALDDELGYRIVGFYATREKAEQAIRRVQSAPGFFDWPDGFRILEADVNRDGWEEGFINGLSDDWLIDGDERRVEPAPIPAVTADRENFAIPSELYVLWFFKIGSEDPIVIDGQEFYIGLYTSTVEARAAIERLRPLLGFRDWPDGFRIIPRNLNRDSWPTGFIESDDPARDVSRLFGTPGTPAARTE